MFKRLIKNKKAQQTAEYAILIALVVGAVIAMQTYAQRTIQARIRGASKYMASGAGESTGLGQNILGTDLQYEPYYLDQQYDVTRDETTDQRTGAGQNLTSSSLLGRTRASGGYQRTGYNPADNSNW
jgi:hypothetical protein